MFRIFDSLEIPLFWDKLLPVPILNLRQAGEAGDAECCWYLAYMHLSGKGVEADPQRARALLEQACRLGSTDACEALRQAALPPFEMPIMSAPGWSTDFPLS